MKRASKNITLRDIARLSGVSTTTVARVVHNNGYVAARTRRKVEAALSQTGYQINALAQGLRKQRTTTIGHVLTAISPNPFFAGVALGAEQEAMAHGYSALLFNTQSDPERERLGVQTLISRRVDAILFTTALDPDNVQAVLDSGIFVVQVERPTEISTPSVHVNNYAGAHKATEYLIELGHHRIAYVGGLPQPGLAAGRGHVEADRKQGYLDALQAHGIEPDTRCIQLRDYYSLHDNRHVQQGYEGANIVLEQQITAIFAASDLLAAGALQAIYERGLRVPQDISLIGFDDTYGAVLSPPLTTVRQPMQQMGQVAVQIAIQALEDEQEQEEEPESQPQRVTLMPELVQRASTGAPKTE